MVLFVFVNSKSNGICFLMKAVSHYVFAGHLPEFILINYCTRFRRCSISMNSLLVANLTYQMMLSVNINVDSVGKL